jgi:hypothetical protein
MYAHIIYYTHTFVQMWRVTCEAPRGSICATSDLAKLQVQPVEQQQHCEKLQFVLYSWRLVLATGGSQEVLILCLNIYTSNNIVARVRVCQQYSFSSTGLDAAILAHPSAVLTIVPLILRTVSLYLLCYSWQSSFGVWCSLHEPVLLVSSTCR